MDSPFRHAKTRGFVSSTELSMKRAAPATPEARPRFQKVSLVSRRLESSVAPQGREGSPSRVSVLLQAWEREIVEKTAAAPAGLVQRQRSSSISLLKDFTPHGPVFAQVYSPVQKPRRQDERGKAVASTREAPMHRESYLHGALGPPRVPQPPAAPPPRSSSPTGSPRNGFGSVAGTTPVPGSDPGSGPAVPRARHVTVLRVGKEAAGSEPRVLEEELEAPNGAPGTMGTAGERSGHGGSDGSDTAAPIACTPVSSGAAGVSQEEKRLVQSELIEGDGHGRDRNSPGDLQSGKTSSGHCPTEAVGAAAEQEEQGSTGEWGSPSEQESTVEQGRMVERESTAEQGITSQPESVAELGSTLEQGSMLEQGRTSEQGSTLEQGTMEEQGSTSEQGSMEEQGSTSEQGSMEEQGCTEEGASPTAATPLQAGSNAGAAENPSMEESSDPEPFPEARGPLQAPAVEQEVGETGDPQGSAQELENGMESPVAPSEPAGSPAAEEDAELLVDMELFVDTLRNMEPSEMRKAPKGPRQPRPWALGRCAALPPIHEGRVVPRVLPTALRELPEPVQSPEEEPESPYMSQEQSPEEEIENPYASQEQSPEEEIENPYASCEETLAAPAAPRRGGPAKGKAEAEMASLLGALRREQGRLGLPRASAEASVLFRGNVLKGMALLSDFLERRAAAADDGRPYSRLDSSVLYSRFVAPTAAQLEAPGTAEPAPADGPCPDASLALQEGPSPSHVPPVPKEPAPKSTPCPVDALQEDKETCKKINVRPGKIILFSEPGFAGQRREIWGDVADATSWELSHTISIRVIRGGWVMYEKPQFHGRKCVLAEGDVEINNPWTAYGQSGPFRIGSFKRVVRDYRVPEISLFAEENGEGTRLTFTDSAEDTRAQGRPLTASSIIVHSGLWLVYSKPFFDDDPYVLEPGGYPNLKAWGAKDPSICSMHPIRLGCPVVERAGEPQVLIYEDAGFQGRSVAVSRDIYDLRCLPALPLPTAGSLHILGGCWVGYEKEGFRGHQYLLEEGEYHDWTQWGGYSKELLSLRLIRTDFSAPALVLFEAMDFEEGPSVELSEALPDTRLAGYGPVTQSIHVLSGVWVAYEGPNFSGEQYVLEKGVYRNCEDWGAADCRVTSVQPIGQVGEHNLHFVSKIQLFSEPDFLGVHVSFEDDQDTLPANFVPCSCRVRGGSWILFDGPAFTGEQHVLSAGEYPTLGAMGCLSSTVICSLRKVPVFFSEPSIFLHGLECFEGKEIELNTEVRSLQAEGFNNHVLSVRVKGGIWVLCEHGDFRGRQWLLDCTEITNWLTYSGLQHVGSLYPIRQRRIYFRIRSKELEGFLCVPDDVEDMKAGRVVVSSLSDQSSFIWFYEEGLIKNQVAPNMSLQVIGPAGKGAKAVLWSENRVPRQTWSIDSSGRIHSQMFEDMILDIKGGRSYDRDHAIIWDRAEERPTQVWDIQVL